MNTPGHSTLRPLVHPVSGVERVWLDPAPIRAAAPAVQAQRQGMGFILRPQVRDRWTSATARAYTPERVEQVVRSAVSGNLVAQWELFDLMEGTDPRLAKNLNQVKDAVISVDWSVQAWAAKGAKATPEANRRADLVEELIWNMEPDPDADENGFEDTIRDLLDARGKGISVLEIDWAMAKTALGSAIRPRATRWVHPRNYGYPAMDSAPDRLMLDARELAAAGVVLPVGQGSHVRFPANKFLLGIWKVKTGHPVGSAMLRLLGFYWAAKNFTWEWFLNFGQLFGVPLRWATYDPNISPADRLELLDFLEGMGSAAYGAFPAGTTIDLKDPARSGTDNPQTALLDRVDQIYDLLILGQTLTSQVGSSGSLALGKVHESVLDSVKIGCADWVARVLNQQLVRAICRLNFGNTDQCPALLPALAGEEDPIKLAERDAILMGKCGMRMPVDYMHDRHKVPMPDEGTPVLEAPSPKPAGPGADDDDDPEAVTAIQARSAQEKLVENVLEDLTAVEARWLGGVKPFFRDLVRKAEEESVSDADLVDTLVKAKAQMPELFEKLDTQHLADAMEAAMGAACLNGAVAGHMKRGTGRRRR